MATGTIKSIKQKTGTVTKIGNAGVSNIVVKQFGKVVTVNGYADNISVGTANSNVNVATVSGVSLPPTIIRTFCGVGNNAYSPPQNIGFLGFDTNGTLYIQSPSTGTKQIYLSFSYVAN